MRREENKRDEGKEVLPNRSGGTCGDMEIGEEKHVPGRGGVREDGSKRGASCVPEIGESLTDL